MTKSIFPVDHSFTRRQFLKNVSVNSAILALHPSYLFSTCTQSSATSSVEKNYLIENIKLHTAASFDRMKEFYVQKMGFPVTKESTKEITFVAGKSTVTFIKSTLADFNPWYHFAFNIPENKLLKARKWLLQRSPIIPTPKRAQDPRFPIEVRHFPHWNAHSLFFWDPAGNLLEFIARHDLNNASTGAFTEKDIINISEIAFVVEDQHGNSEMLNLQFELSEYPKGSSFWWAMGDEHGLLLCIPKRIWGENTAAPKTFSIFPTEVKIVGNKTKSFQFDGYPYVVTV